MNHLITGGCGFVGSNLAVQLMQPGERVVVLDNLSRAGSASNLAWLKSQGAVEFVHGDTRNSGDVEALLEANQFDAVYHLAGQVAMTTSVESPRRDFETNVVGTINLLEALRKNNRSAAVVYASSNKVYGDLRYLELRESETRFEPSGSVKAVDESAHLNFQTPYGCSKGAADQYMLDYARMYDLNTVVFRHSTIFGGRQYATYDQGWVGWFCRKALEVATNPEAPAFTISGSGKQVRDLLHVDDAVAAYRAAAAHAPKARGEAFNIGGGVANSMSLRELLSFLEHRLNVTLQPEQLPFRASDQMYFVADNTKATRWLDWQPKIDKKSGLERMLEWESRCMGFEAIPDRRRSSSVHSEEAARAQPV